MLLVGQLLRLLVVRGWDQLYDMRVLDGPLCAIEHLTHSLGGIGLVAGQIHRPELLLQRPLVR